MRGGAHRKLLLVLAGLSLLGSANGCGRAARKQGPFQGEIAVYAASSLKEGLEEISAGWEALHPGSTIVAHYAGSQDLRVQIEHGAPADVVATADWKQMEALTRAALVGSAQIFACNEPVVVVPEDDRIGISTFADLGQAKRIAIGAAEVPIGAYTLRILDAAGAEFREKVEAAVSSRELNVKQVLAKVSLGEVDAGIVYRSDAVSARGQVRAVPIPTQWNVIVEYPIAVVRASKRQEAAAAFVGYVLLEGSAPLEKAGFTRCPAR